MSPNPLISLTDATGNVIGTGSGVIPTSLSHTASLPSPTIARVVTITASSSAITNAVALGSAPAGVYRISVALVLTTAGTSGNLAVTLGYTDSAQAETVTTAVITNINAKGQANACVVIQNAATGNIVYSTSFSGTQGAAVYDLHLVVEQIG